MFEVLKEKSIWKIWMLCKEAWCWDGYETEASNNNDWSGNGYSDEHGGCNDSNDDNDDDGGGVIATGNLYGWTAVAIMITYIEDAAAG
jgi:hypothetical protein